MKKRSTKLLALLLSMMLVAGMTGCGAEKTEETKADAETKVEEQVEEKTEEKTEEKSEEKTDDKKVADSSETTEKVEIVEEGMVPIAADKLKDGVYPVNVSSTSSMFKIESCDLTVKEGKMTAKMVMGGKGYLKLFMGTGEEALKADEAQMIPFEEIEGDKHVFTVPVEALDKAIDCSAFSKKKEKWYDRQILFRADSLPLEAFAEGMVSNISELKLEDGKYTVNVTLAGGSGKASVQSPASLTVKDGKATATIIWSSSNYDYMKIGDKKIEPVTMEGGSTFEIPVDTFDWNIPVIADTIAMSTPHEIEYTLNFDSTSLQKAE